MLGRPQSSFCDHIQRIKGKQGLLECSDREFLETIKQNPNGNSRVSIMTNKSIDRATEITTLKNKKQNHLRKMNSLRDVWDNMKQFYTHCNWHSRKRRNEKNGRKRNNVKAS